MKWVSKCARRVHFVTLKWSWFLIQPETETVGICEEHVCDFFFFLVHRKTTFMSFWFTRFSNSVLHVNVSMESFLSFYCHVIIIMHR